MGGNWDVYRKYFSVNSWYPVDPIIYGSTQTCISHFICASLRTASRCAREVNGSHYISSSPSPHPVSPSAYPLTIHEVCIPILALSEAAGIHHILWINHFIITYRQVTTVNKLNCCFCCYSLMSLWKNKTYSVSHNAVALLTQQVTFTLKDILTIYFN